MDHGPVVLVLVGTVSEIETLKSDTDRISEWRAIDDIRGYRVCKNVLEWCILGGALHAA